MHKQNVHQAIDEASKALEALRGALQPLSHEPAWGETLHQSNPPITRHLK
jgi:hypothetical protein